MAEDGLRFGPLTETCVHVCVDMQRLFAQGSEWHAEWIERVLPTVERIVAAHPERTILTRFIPLRRAEEGVGTWRRYYQRWESMTLDQLPPEMVELLPELARFVPPAEVLDKTVYSPWLAPGLEASLRRRGADTLIITGTETDVCVLATVLGAIDRGYRVIIPTDAICSSSDSAYDASLHVYRRRYRQQVETASTDEILQAWR